MPEEMSFVLMASRRDDPPMTKATIIPAGESSVVIRIATPADRDDLRRLAALDSARVPDGALLLAESDGEIRAAYSLDEDRAIADPFVASAGLVELLEARAGLLRGDRRARTAHGARGHRLRRPLLAHRS
jgi:hypothetical protein